MSANLGELARESNSRETRLDLRRITYELLSLVRVPTLEERNTLKGTGLTFFKIEAKSLGKLEQENPNHFSYINSSDRLITYIPLPMVVAIDLEQLFMPDSFKKSEADQLVMIKERSLARQKDFPDAREIMLPASALAQLDMKRKIFENSFARALDQTEGSDVAIVGRIHPAGRLRVGDSDADDGVDDVGVLSTVVFIRNR